MASEYRRAMLVVAAGIALLAIGGILRSQISEDSSNLILLGGAACLIAALVMAYDQSRN